jgi:ubiquinone/menaquinone biosynthesis C-methylase UbiE
MTGLVEPVTRSHRDARRTYDRLSLIFDVLEDPFERRTREAGLQLLRVQPGDRVLDVGAGTGHSLVAMADAVGPAGSVVGLDLSQGMEAVSLRRLERAGLEDRVGLIGGDASHLPLPDGCCDHVFMSFVLELFDTPEIPVVLGECRRVLRPRGRLGVVALNAVDDPGPLARLYVAGHRRFPRLLDCRPIPVRSVVQAAGLRVELAVSTTMWGLPVALVIAAKIDTERHAASEGAQ